MGLVIKGGGKGNDVKFVRHCVPHKSYAMSACDGLAAESSTMNIRFCDYICTMVRNVISFNVMTNQLGVGKSHAIQ